MIKIIILSLGFFCLSLTAVLAQTPWGNGNSRTDAALQGNQGALSGFFETGSPVNYPPVGSWWQFLDVRHRNTNNNYAMRFAGGFFDRQLWFRKTNGHGTTGWGRIVLERDNAASIESRLSHQDGRFATIYTEEIEKNRLDAGETQALLLKKIEELTLYITGQNKKLKRWPRK